jgi:DNA topoisomerase-1
MDKSTRSAGRQASVRQLARKLGLVMVKPDALTITRERQGKRVRYRAATGKLVTDKAEIARLSALAVPPAYEDVRFATDPRAHLQATGRDAAGRTQYRYHADWTEVRETRKAQRLAQFVAALPRIRRAVRRSLCLADLSQDFALSAVIELVANSSIRAGSEEYAKEGGTRGATTLLKSNVRMENGLIGLHFRGKGKKDIVKTVNAPSLGDAIETLRKLPGKRLFQYRDASGNVHAVCSRDVNLFLQDIAGTRITLKDYRTLCASATVLEALSKQQPAASERGRKRQISEAVRNAAEDLSNTPTVCRKSYVHEAVVQAFENGVLEEYRDVLKATRSPSKREEILGEVVAAAC